MRRKLCPSIILFLLSAIPAQLVSAEVSLFDGQSLKGWKGKTDLWSVKDGAIVGSTRPNGASSNTFLIHEKPFEDFVLTLEFKLLGGNSGVQFRSSQVEKPEDHAVAGYQADMGEGWYGSLYDERRRGMLAESNKEWTSRFQKKDDWNRYEIHAIGNRITLRLNGLTTAEYVEKDDSVARKGIIALQLHGGEPMEVHFRNIRIAEKEKKKLLYVTTAAGFAHSSRPLSRDVVKKLGRDSGEFEAVATDTTELIHPQGLEGLDAVMFYTTGGKDAFPLSPANRDALIAWVKSGKAFIGVHSATDTYADWEPYWEMIGGSFDGHPWNAGDPAIGIDVEDPSHPAAIAVPGGWKIQDEIYQLKNWSRDKVHVILSMNDASAGKGSRKDKDYAIAWCKNHEKGKVFYTSLGHREDVWTNPVYQEHLLGGILWTLGAAPGDATPGLAKPSNEFTNLFDGKTLSDWTPNDRDKAQWEVIEGGFVTGKGDQGHLFSPKEYANFHYKAEVNINDKGNSGMYFRARKGRQWPEGYEAQVNSTYENDPVKTGSLYGIKKVFEQLVPPDTWFTQEVIAYGDLIIIKVNGKVTAREVVPNKWARGRFAFQHHDPTCKVQYRNVMVRELPSLDQKKTASAR